MLIVDSREQWTRAGSKDRHIPNWLDKHGIEWTVHKLEVGDYMLGGHPELVIDRKKDLSEMATNLMNRTDKARFWREVRRAREQGTRLIVLCEHGRGIEKIEDVKNWKSEYSPVTGRALMEQIYRVHMAYQVDFLFTDKRHCAQRIMEILGDDGYKRGGNHPGKRDRAGRGEGAGAETRPARTVRLPLP